MILSYPFLFLCFFPSLSLPSFVLFLYRGFPPKMQLESPLID